MMKSKNELKNNYPEIYRKTSLNLRDVKRLRNFYVEEQNLYEQSAVIGSIAVKIIVTRNMYSRESDDLDFACFCNNIGNLVRNKIKKERLKDLEIRKNYIAGYYLEISDSPFEVYKIYINTLAEPVDIFTEDTGVGPIPLEKYDWKIRKQLTLDNLRLNILNIGFYYATFLNPMAISETRFNKALVLLQVDDNYRDSIDYFTNKLRNSLGVLRDLKKENIVDDFRIKKYIEKIKKISNKVKNIPKNKQRKIGKEKINYLLKSLNTIHAELLDSYY